MKGRKDGLGRTGTNAGWERIDSPSRPEPRVAAGDHDREGSRARTDGQRVHSRDRSPQIEPVPAGGSDNGRKGFNERYLRLVPNPDFMVYNEPRREVGRIYPPPSAFLIEDFWKPDGTSTFPFRLLCLIVYDHVQDDLRDPNISATAKLRLRGVINSSDAFCPLKYVVGGLCFILDNCNVWPSFYLYPQCS